MILSSVIFFLNIPPLFDIFIQPSNMYSRHKSRGQIHCVCVYYNKACSSEEIDTVRYLGGDPYGRSQSDVDGITATFVLMRSSLVLMSDRMTVRGGPHGS